MDKRHSQKRTRRRLRRCRLRAAVGRRASAASRRELGPTPEAAGVGVEAFAVAGQALYGNVDVEAGLLLAVPAVVGVVAGTAVQQRLPQPHISLLFAALLVAVAVELIIP